MKQPETIEKCGCEDSEWWKSRAFEHDALLKDCNAGHDYTELGTQLNPVTWVLYQVQMEKYKKAVRENKLWKLLYKRWLSVDDVLPKENVKVLLCDNGLVDCGILIDGEWQIITNGGWDSCENVTHWQPLQKAPKEVRNAP